MKVFERILIVVISMILLQGCKGKSYEMQFDYLILQGFHNEFKCPEYLKDCVVKIETNDDFNEMQYISTAIKLLKTYEMEPEYQSYTIMIGEGINGVFYIPDVQTCHITIYDNTNLKTLELSYKEGKGITDISIWQDKNLICEAEGNIACCYECFPNYWYFNSGYYKLYESDNNGNQIITKEILTEDCKKTENCLFKKITKEYNKEGSITRKIVENAIECEECPESNFYFEVVEDSYSNNAKETRFENQQKTKTIEQKKSNLPGWLVGSWRSPLDGNGVLIVNLYPDNSTDVKIMNGFTLVSKIEYDGWTIFDNMLYLYNNGEKIKESPSFYIDFNNHIIIGHNGERFQKH